MFNLLNKVARLITVFVGSILVCYSIVTQTYAASDPTQPLIGGTITLNTPKKISSFVLQSVIKSAQQYKVVINGKLLRRGDKIMQYKVGNITTRKVILTSKEKHITLFLFGQNKIVNVVNH